MSNPIEQFKQMLDKSIETAKQARFEEDRRKLMSTIGQDLAKMLAPVLNNIASTSKNNKEDLRDVMSEIMGEVSNLSITRQGIDTKPIIEAIQQAFGVVHIPQPKVTVNVPDVIVPEIKMPDEMNIKGWVQLQGVNLDNPLPVQLRDAKGKAINLFENLTTIMGGGGGGFQYVTVSGFGASAYADYLNADGRLRVSVETGGGDLTDAQLRASSVPVAQASGANWSVEMATQPITFDVKQVSGSADSVNASQVGTWIVDQLSGASWSVAATKSGLWDIDQLSGANWSVFATNPVGQGDSATALRVIVAGDSAASVSATQVGTWTVSVSGSLASAVAVGPSAVGVADDGNAPVQIGGIGRTTNPTKVTDGQVVKSSHDAVGRQLMRPVQVRGLLQTAYLSLTTGTEATLLAGVAGVFMDLVYVMATNSSDAAVTVDLRAATAAGIQTSIRVPANGTAGVALPVPIPQDAAADTWTADMPDITGTTVTIGALFSREV